MPTKTEKSFSLLFIFLLALEIITSSFKHLQIFNYIAKPALLISLILFFWKQSSHLEKKIKLLIVLALICSLLGDILLMFTNHSAYFFMGGLLAFLSAHIFYVLVFLKQRNKSKKGWVFMGLMLVYGILLFYFLRDGLNNLLYPVIIYM
ncbi:MAG TPA: lysoplasmalogenase, partial [Xanthomarina gelatinilytica]|nr:lysoplasmalogenase [Xanthomarina gelatinilytica]